jgi:hypothetical protein
MPARMDFSWVVSKTTRKYEIKDIISHMIRKTKTLCTVTKATMDKKNAHNSIQARVILPEEYSPFKYPIENTAEGIETMQITQRKNKESGSHEKKVSIIPFIAFG